MADSLIIHMRQRIAECRRLASVTTDDRMADVLRQMADEGEADIRLVSLASSQSAAPTASAIRQSENAETADLGRSFSQLRALLPNRPAGAITEDHVQSLISARRGREALFGRHLFSDPAWDVIMELYAARLGGRQMSASELARAINVPGSVIARWIAVLVEAGIVFSAQDREVPDRMVVQLTEEGAGKMQQLAAQWKSAFMTI